jgi:hypothetical protein
MRPHQQLGGLRSSALRWCSTDFVCVCSHRTCATLQAQRITPATPVLHSTLTDAHIHASCLLAELVEARQPASLVAYVQLTEEWWRAVEQLVLLPLQAEAIHDLPQYLMECAGVSRPSKASARTHTLRAASDAQAAEDEARLLEQWEEWVWTSVPRTAPTAAASRETIDDGDRDNEESGAGGSSSSRGTLEGREVMSFPQLTSLLSSYSRYHRGVRWGAAHPPSGSRGGKAEDGAAAAAYYRRRYLLHPWHGLCCPEGTAQQMPYVHVLRWMLAGVEGRKSPEELWREHKAVEGFAVSTAATGTPFRALDMCSQSGYATDLLLRAGADLVVAVDPDQQALGNTEATFHEHIREERSKRRGQVLLTRRCDGLPMPKKLENSVVEKMRQESSDEEASTASTSASAAERRRQRARQEGRGYSGMRSGAQSMLNEPLSSSFPQGCADGSPFHVVYVHPPAAHTVWPITAAHARTSLHNTPWWRSLVRRAAADGVPPQLLLPFVPCDALPTTAGRRCPLATLSGLRRTVESLRADVTERRSTSLPNSSASDKLIPGSHGSDALLEDEGYVVLVLPRTFDTADLLVRVDGQPRQRTAQEERQPSLSLSDWVVAQLDGYYDLVLRRRCAVDPPPLPSSGLHLSVAEKTLLTYPLRLRHVNNAAGDEVNNKGGDNCGGLAERRPSAVSWAEQLSRLYQSEWWQDVLVLRKNLAMVRRCAAARDDALPLFLQQRLSQLRKAKTDVAWEDSFEYNEYHPRDVAPLTSHHWADLVPTYSYLEPDFYDSPSVQRNFLAVGHPPAPSPAASSAATAKATSTGYGVPALEGGVTSARDDGVVEASAQAAMNFHTLFAQELRTRRRSKLRKLALSPLERQEWYIDEKLIKSSGARVELMNELSRWDLKDYDR